MNNATDAGKRRIKKAAGAQTGETRQKTAKNLTWPVQQVPTKTNTGPDQYGQQGSTAAANRARIKVSGLDSRTRGFVSARSRRSQASRDAKG